MKQSQLKELIKHIVREVMASRADLDKGVMKAVNVEEEQNEQTATGAVAGYSTPFAFKKKKEESLDEMTATGAVAGYATPYAFSKKKSGSQRAVDVTKKMGMKVVGDAPRV